VAAPRSLSASVRPYGAFGSSPLSPYGQGWAACFSLPWWHELRAENRQRHTACIWLSVHWVHLEMREPLPQTASSKVIKRGIANNRNTESLARLINGDAGKALKTVVREAISRRKTIRTWSGMLVVAHVCAPYEVSNRSDVSLFQVSRHRSTVVAARTEHGSMMKVSHARYVWIGTVRCRIVLVSSNFRGGNCDAHQSCSVRHRRHTDRQ
jgi:hypothetical protein